MISTSYGSVLGTFLKKFKVKSFDCCCSNKKKFDILNFQKFDRLSSNPMSSAYYAYAVA